jgi:apolipoprotein N-acyltransferase
MANLLFQSYHFIGLSIVVGVLAVSLIYWILNKSPISEWLKASEGIIVSFITIPAFLFGLALSTLASGIWDGHVSANLSLVNESGAITTLALTSTNLAPQDKLRLTEAINNYVTAVVDKEWPAMKAKKPMVHNIASPEFEALRKITDAIAMKPNQHSLIANRLESSMNILQHERLLRSSLAYEGTNIGRWPSIFSLSFLLLLTVGLLQLRSPRAMKISLAMGAFCIGSAMLFIFLNLSPYSGLNPVTADLLNSTVSTISPTNTGLPQEKH